MPEYLLSINAGEPPEEWQVTCMLFAPNAPEQNPVEDIWLFAIPYSLGDVIDWDFVSSTR